MAKKTDVLQFLNKELQTKAAARGLMPLPEQASINAAAAARVEAQVRRLPTKPEVGKEITL